MKNGVDYMDELLVHVKEEGKGKEKKGGAGATVKIGDL